MTSVSPGSPNTGIATLAPLSEEKEVLGKDQLHCLETASENQELVGKRGGNGWDAAIASLGASAAPITGEPERLLIVDAPTGSRPARASGAAKRSSNPSEHKNAPVCNPPNLPTTANRIQPIYMMQPPAGAAAVQPPTIVSAHPSTTHYCLVHCWYFVYIMSVLGFLLAFLWVYRLPLFNEKLKLEIQKMELVVRKTELETNARIREAEIQRDLQLDIEKLRLSQEHEKNMEGQKISQKLTEKFMDSNTETVEKSSGIWNKERTVKKRTYLERTDMLGFSKLISGKAGFSDVAGNAAHLLTDRVTEYLSSCSQEDEACSASRAALNDNGPASSDDGTNDQHDEIYYDEL